MLKCILKGIEVICIFMYCNLFYTWNDAKQIRLLLSTQYLFDLTSAAAEFAFDLFQFLSLFEKRS